MPVLASLGGGQRGATCPAAHASGPWGHLGTAVSLKHGGEPEPLGLAGSHLPAGESAGLCPRAPFTTSGAMKEDFSNFESVPSHISSSYLKNGLYLLSGGIRKLT